MPKCPDEEHVWREMDWKEAYPASSGKVCIKCDIYQLGWFANINQPGGEELDKKIIEVM